MGRAKKGTVRLRQRGGMLALRWTWQGREFNLALGLADTPPNRDAALGKAALVEADIRLDRFDPTLAKYRPAPPAPAQASSLEIFDRFTDHRRAQGVSQQTLGTRYRSLRANLERFGRSIEGEQDALAFRAQLIERQQASGANRNIALLKSCYEWAIGRGLAESNPFAAIAPLKTQRQINPKRTAMTRTEIAAFLTAIEDDPIRRHYRDYCLTLFSLGLRPSEASGLRWQHIDWQKSTVTVSEALGRNEDGRSAGYARQRKPTKTGRARLVKLAPHMITMLQSRRPPDSDPDALIFTTITGKPIDDRLFCQRVWRPICQQIGIDKVPYAARHSLASHLLDSGANVAQVSSVLGNTIETCTRNYLHQVSQPQMPDF